MAEKRKKRMETENCNLINSLILFIMNSDSTVRIQDDMLQTVVFICTPKKGSEEQSEPPIIGTGFLAIDPNKNKVGKDHLYLVTAKHVAKKISNGDVVIRLNNKQGVSEYFTDENARWFYHPTDESVDVAVASCTITPNIAKYKAISFDMFLTDKIMEQGKIGIGDEVYMIGLFAYVTGSKTNQPIARVGNIAMIPRERIPVEINKIKHEIEVYLIEARSTKGLSGSPVLVRESLPNIGKHYLLGLAMGHWGPGLKNYYRFNTEYENDVNIGIAVVVPAKKILEVINHPLFVKFRNEKDNKQK